MAKQTTAATKKKPAAKSRKSTVAKTSAAPTRRNGGDSGAKGRSLVIVESPAKATTIGRFLGNKYTVKASMGHVRDLPDGSLGVDPEHEFLPQYQVMKDKKTIVADLKKAGANASSIYLATDPDREGEAISWHLLEAAGWKDVPIRRVVFHAITPEAVKEAFEMHHVDVDVWNFEAQDHGADLLGIPHRLDGPTDAVRHMSEMLGGLAREVQPVILLFARDHQCVTGLERRDGEKGHADIILPNEAAR